MRDAQDDQGAWHHEDSEHRDYAQRAQGGQGLERSEPPEQTYYIGRLIPLWNRHAYLNSEVQYNLLAFRIKVESFTS